MPLTKATAGAESSNGADSSNGTDARAREGCKGERGTRAREGCKGERCARAREGCKGERNGTGVSHYRVHMRGGEMLGDVDVALAHVDEMYSRRKSSSLIAMVTSSSW